MKKECSEYQMISCDFLYMHSNLRIVYKIDHIPSISIVYEEHQQSYQMPGE